MTRTNPAVEQLGHLQSRLPLKLTLLLVASLTIMSGATIAPSLPGIQAAYAAYPHAVFLSRLVLTLPGLFVAISSPLIGKLADRIGRKPLLVGSIALYAVAGSSGLYVDSLYTLLAGRACLGVAVAGIMTLGTALAGDYFPGPERAGYMGLQQAFTGLGGLLFLTLGGYLAEIQWRFPFAIYLSALLLAPLTQAILQEPNKTRASGSAPSNDGYPGIRAIVGICATALMTSTSFYLIPSQLPFHLRELGIVAPTKAGVAIGLLTLSSATASLAYAQLHRVGSSTTIFVTGILAMALGLATVGWATSFPTILTGTTLVGLGLGAVMPNLLSQAMTIASGKTRGGVAGWVTACIFLGQFISPFMSQPLIERGGYALGFLGGTFCMCCTLIPVLFICSKIPSHRRAT